MSNITKKNLSDMKIYKVKIFMLHFACNTNWQVQFYIAQKQSQFFIKIEITPDSVEFHVSYERYLHYSIYL